MSAASGQWTLGVLVGLPIAAFFVLVGIVIAVVATYIALTSKDEGEKYQSIDEWRRWPNRYHAQIWAVMAAMVVFFIALPVAIGFYPWKAEYHQWRPVRGTVAQMASRIVSSGDDHGGSTQKFVVTLTSGPQQYAIDDTRAALLHPGDAVSIRCKRVWDYGSNDAGYDCKWGQS